METPPRPLEETLSFKESLLEAQSEASIDGILVVSPGGKILSFNQRFVEIWKVRPHILETRSDHTALEAVLSLLANPNEFLERITYLYEHPDEKSREEITLNDGRVLDRYSAPVIHASGQFFGRVWFFRDITEQKRIESELQRRDAELAQRVQELEVAILKRKRAEQAMRNLALHDDLTGLYNNRGFYTLAEHYLKLARRLGQHSLLIYADVDGLKRINDGFGHTEGSLAIATIADILRNSFRESDIIGRVGGDEFAILAQDSSAADMDNITTHLQESLLAYNKQSNRSYDLALSFGGISIDPDNDLSLDHLIAKADKLMYDHKRSKSQTSISMLSHATVEHQRVLRS